MQYCVGEFMRFPTWLVTDYPWLKDVAPVLSYFQELWHEYHNLIFLFGLIAIWRLLRRERMKLADKVDTLSQLVKAVRDESEEAFARPASALSAQPFTNGHAELQTDFDRWECIRSNWRNIRDRLELVIENISGNRVRGKYSKFPRYNYRRIVNALQMDREVTPKVSNELLRMDTMFNTVKFRPKGISAEEFEKFQDSYNVVDKFLPRLPDTSLPHPEPEPDPAPFSPASGARQAA
jgi:hypothetical protein